jgi:hypothetical protein
MRACNLATYILISFIAREQLRATNTDSSYLAGTAGLRVLTIIQLIISRASPFVDE